MDEKQLKYYLPENFPEVLKDIEFFAGSDIDKCLSILSAVHLAGAHAQAEADQEAVENECGDFGTPDKGFDLCYRKAIRALGVAEIKEAK